MTNERAVEILNLDLDILGQYGGESAEAYKMAIKALEQQPSEPRTNLAETSQDCISREEAINEADNLSLETSYDNEKVEQMLRDLPPVKPKRPKGKWIETPVENDIVPVVFKCSECGMRIVNPYKYCPNCGSYNGGEKE